MRVHIHVAGMPKAETYSDLERNLQFEDERKNDIEEDTNDMIKLALFEKFLDVFGKKFDDFTDFLKISKGLEDRYGAPWTEEELWKSDEEFARQCLNGINPVLLRRCRDIPDKFKVSTLME